MTEEESEKQVGDTRNVSSEQVRDALVRVLDSAGFKGSARMRSFLTYVVEEALAGRTDEIRAKTIAMDVYGYSADELTKREGVVRVDAGRVRRKLKAYYGSAGASDPIVISLPLGGYAPDFKPGSDQFRKSKKLWRIPVALIVSAILIGVGGFAATFLAKRPSSSGIGAEQTTIYDVSPARVEAMNLCSAGRDVMFPVVNLPRLKPALLIFETAIERDPHYYCGYAGAAQVETMLAILQFADPAAEEMLATADENSAYALELEPDAAWALSSRAWLEFGLGKYDKATALSRRAVNIAPNDPHIAEFDALISLYTLKFTHILSESERYEKLAQSSGGLVFGNVLGAAQFHTGDFAAAIRTYEDTIARGGPFGPISAAYLMAARWSNGEQIEARRLANLYKKTWPGFPLEALKRRAFKEPEPVDALVNAMKAAGVSLNSGGADVTED
ncbi:adenylate cyclase [uncultured Ruegeria sp.]|uniref:adenylate cyclase n=1 Tax=uncultured Ruegeria sp. TaxID=259304 RepID=UPI0026155746|nr:adenylate cyclase [uncultured Ruegeria sp.]